MRTMKLGGVDVLFVEIISHKSVTLKDTYYQSMVSNMVSNSKFLAVIVAKHSRQNNLLEIIQDLSIVFTRRALCNK